MAVTIIKEPAKVCLTGNNIEFTLGSDNMYESEGVKFSGFMYQLNPALFNQTLVFTWGNNSYTTQPGNPVEQGYHIYCQGISSAYLTGFINCIKKNYLLSKDFDISWYLYQGSYHIGFVAKYPGTDYNLSFNIAGYWGVTIYGIDKVIRNFFRIGWQLMKYNPDNDIYNSTGEVQLEVPDDEGEITIDVSELLQEEITGQFTYPESIDSLINLRTDIAGKYYIKYFEYYGLPPEYKTVCYSSVYIYLQGEISQLRMAALKQKGLSFWTWLTTKHNFLTFCPDKKIISLNQPEKLYFIMPYSRDKIKLHVSIYYTDGSNTYSFLEEYDSALQYDVFEFIVGYAKTQIENIDPDKTINKYEISLTDEGNNRISAIRTYILDHTYYEFERYFLFKNSIGVFESFRATGINTRNIDIDKTFLKSPISSEYELTEKYIKPADINKDVYYQINSGYIKDLKYVNYLPEFLGSNDIYYLDTVSAYPVNILPGKYKLEKDKEGIYYIEFEYSFAIQADSTEEFLQIIKKGSFNASFNKSFR